MSMSAYYVKDWAYLLDIGVTERDIAFRSKHAYSLWVALTQSGDR